MKIAVLQASSQKDKNEQLFDSTRRANASGNNEVINFGVFKNEQINVSYIDTAIWISILLESKSIDFVVTGCSSGQGMMLACNSLPGVICGYVANVSDAFLFSKINNGNSISYPLALNYGWVAEINLQSTLDKLFEEPFGTGYPKESAERKIRDTELMKQINSLSKLRLVELLLKLDRDHIKSVLNRNILFDYFIENHGNEELLDIIMRLK